jgi:hypothetical protein
MEAFAMTPTTPEIHKYTTEEQIRSEKLKQRRRIDP